MQLVAELPKFTGAVAGPVDAAEQRREEDADGRVKGVDEARKSELKRRERSEVVVCSSCISAQCTWRVGQRGKAAVERHSQWPRLTPYASSTRK